jgi:hypothetical protein
MTEADRVFSGMQGRTDKPASIEQRFIQRRHRQGGSSYTQTRVVEVVHVRRSGRQPVVGQADQASTAAAGPGDLAGSAARHLPEIGAATMFEPPQPVVHVMPMWEPHAEQAQPAAPPDDGPTEAPARSLRKGRAPRRQPGARPYANPFAEEEGGANCLRCGYLVEPVREQQGRLTCAKCG